jgi:uncharacterized protein (TIGR02453 family)
VPSSPSFDPDLFAFFRDLKADNSRAWFEANRERYIRSVEGPMLQFITDVGARLPQISKAFRADARRFGGSLYRLQRDTRFSPDKSPYKTWTAAIFRHRSARKGHQAPGFYLHLDPEHNFGGGGAYRPDQPVLTRIRQYLAEHVDDWQKVRDTGIEIRGERLTRVPAGFSRTHPLAEDLKMKDFYTGVGFSEADVTAPGFIDRYLDCCQQAAPLVKFLTRSLNLAW